MGKLSLIRDQILEVMKTHSFPSPEETDPRPLEALANLNQISDAINHIGSDDASQNDLSLQLIVESAIRVVPGSSAVIYIYDQATGMFEKKSRYLAEPDGRKLESVTNSSNDMPRSNGIGMRTIKRRRRSLSYEEANLNIHPYHSGNRRKSGCMFPFDCCGTSRWDFVYLSP